MSNYIEHDNCGAELAFIRMGSDSVHSWRAVCTKCRTKQGKRKFVAWVSEAQMDAIVALHANTKVEEQQC